MELYLVWLASLLGSAHCVGMCGGFALAVAGSAPTLSAKLGRGLTYHAGKTATYVVLGLLAGLFGAALTGLPGVALAQNVLSIAAGVAMIAIGLSVAGVTGRFDALHLPGMGWLKGALARALRGRGISGSFAVGLFNGLLPCGLVYAFLVQAAATGSAVGGGLTMLVAGLGTVPALLFFGTSGASLGRPLRAKLSRMGGVLVVVLGLLTMVRGTPIMHRLMGHDMSGETMPAGHPMPGMAPMHHP